MKKIISLLNLSPGDEPYSAEPTPEGIRLISPPGSAPRMLGWADAVRLLDTGEYDGDDATGMHVAASLLEGADAGWYDVSEGDLRAVWRWIVVTVFIAGQEEINGTEDITDEDGKKITVALYAGRKSDIALIPAVERMILAEHIEQGASRFFPAGTEKQQALEMYQNMLTVTPSGLCLSVWGENAFRILHEWLETVMAEQAQPVPPVRH